MPRCWKCHAETTQEHALRIAENKFTLHWDEWDGWRFSGRFLIAPGKAGRILPRRLLGMLWEERQRVRSSGPKIEQSQLDAARIVPLLATLPARERFDGQA